MMNFFTQHDGPLSLEKSVHTTYSRLLKDYDAEVFLRHHHLGRSGHEHEIDVSAKFRVAGVGFLLLVECNAITVVSVSMMFWLLLNE